MKTLSKWSLLTFKHKRKLKIGWSTVEARLKCDLEELEFSFQQKPVVFMLNDIVNLKSGRWKNAVLSLYGETEWQQKKNKAKMYRREHLVNCFNREPGSITALYWIWEKKNMKLQRYWVRHTWIKSRECFRIDPSTFPLSPDFSAWKTRPHQFGSVAVDIQHNNSNRISLYLHLISNTIYSCWIHKLTVRL